MAEAEQELGTLVADLRKAAGPQHPDTLEAEAIAARLRHAQPDGAAAGAAELRAVVERMGEFLGAAHQLTVKWQRVLEEMIAGERIAEGVGACWLSGLERHGRRDASRTAVSGVCVRRRANPSRIRF